MNEQHTTPQAWGLTDALVAAGAAYPSLCVGRILSQEKAAYRLICAHGEQNAAVSGKLRYAAKTPSDYPAVGDFVMLDPETGGGTAVIHAVLPRKSLFVRRAAGTSGGEQVVAANVDVVFLCMALNRDFNLRRLERYLSIAWESGAMPVVVLTKSDLCPDIEEKRLAVSSVAAGVDILVTSALEDSDCAAIRPYLSGGRTVALLGSSGAGKSTLINCLLGEPLLCTNGLRDDDKGRHTTTRRQLLMLPGGGLVMDTPGMRELGMWDAVQGLDKTFSDVRDLTRLCRYSDCTHTTEPGCAVIAALENGALSRERWLSWQKLCAENERTQNSRGYLAAKKEKFKTISKINKENRKK